jgi:NAD(P)-dependent dehydrogenase (short-subunit alcohol dehydrogenase family)
MKSIVVITGVQSGIGHATAEVFSKNGWYVIGIGRRTSGDNQFVDHYINADISKESCWAEISAEIRQNEGMLHSIVNNAGVQICKPIFETTSEEWDLVMSTNLKSIFFCVKYLSPLLQPGGSIVNVCSVHAIATSLNIGAYAASKGAILAFTRSLAIELAQKNIRVNAVLPGAVDTPMLRSGLNRGHVRGDTENELVLNLGKKHLLQRIGQPKEIGNVIYFLSDSTQSSFITGQGLIVDGGALAKLSTE